MQEGHAGRERYSRLRSRHSLSGTESKAGVPNSPGLTLWDKLGGLLAFLQHEGDSQVDLGSSFA